MKNLQTGAGQTGSDLIPQTNSNRAKGNTAGAIRGDQVDAINALFAMLEAAYPLKFKRAFPTDDFLLEAKKVWIRNLTEFSPQRILQAGKKALDHGSFFPDLRDIRSYCKLDYRDLGMKEPLQAYYEACQLIDQSKDAPWSHIVVYLAARVTGHLVLRGQPQKLAYPIFQRNYEILCNRVINGEDVEAEMFAGLEDNRMQTMREKTEKISEQAQIALMKKQGIDPTSSKSARDQLKKILCFNRQ